MADQKAKILPSIRNYYATLLKRVSKSSENEPSVSKRPLVIYIMLFVILNVMDYILTRIALHYGGVEANPVARFFIEYELLWLYKFGVVAVIIFLIYKLYIKKGMKKAIFYYRLANVIFLFAVVWNAVMIYLLVAQLS